MMRVLNTDCQWITRASRKAQTALSYAENYRLKDVLQVVNLPASNLSTCPPVSWRNARNHEWLSLSDKIHLDQGAMNVICGLKLLKNMYFKLCPGKGTVWITQLWKCFWDYWNTRCIWGEALCSFEEQEDLKNILY